MEVKVVNGSKEKVIEDVSNAGAAEAESVMADVVEVAFQFFLDIAIELNGSLLEEELFGVAVALSNTVDEELIDNVGSAISLEDELLGIEVVVARVSLNVWIELLRSPLSEVASNLSIPVVFPIAVVEVVIGGQTSAWVIPYLHKPGWP
jgi:hypothetical protein